MRRAKTAMLSLCAIALIGAGSAAAQGAPSVPQGDAFYEAPSPLPPGPAGTVLRQRPLEGTMALPSAARNTLVVYLSVDPRAAPVAVSGTIAVPQGTPPAGGWPVITWTHGTTGIAAICAPSRDTAEGPEHSYIAAIRTLLDGFVARGYAVVATDYQGLGVPGFHPFLQGVPNARNALDMIRAARAIEPQLGARYAVVGHSQGGHADLFTAAEGPLYAPELTLVGNVAFAPGSNIAARLAAVMASDKVEIGLPYLLYVLQSYARYHPEIDLRRILTAEAVSHLPDLMVGCMTHALTTGYWSTAVARAQFLPAPDLAPFLAVAATNEPAALRIAVPTLIVQGASDVTVRPVDTEATVRRMCASGTVLTFRELPGVDHDGSMVSGADEARRFIAARFAGEPAASNCASLPAAAAR